VAYLNILKFSSKFALSYDVGKLAFFFVHVYIIAIRINLENSFENGVILFVHVYEYVIYS